MSHNVHTHPKYAISSENYSWWHVGVVTEQCNYCYSGPILFTRTWDHTGGGQWWPLGNVWSGCHWHQGQWGSYPARKWRVMCDNDMRDINIAPGLSHQCPGQMNCVRWKQVAKNFDGLIKTQTMNSTWWQVRLTASRAKSTAWIFAWVNIILLQWSVILQ